MLEEKINGLHNMKFLGTVNFSHDDTSGEETVFFYQDVKNNIFQEINFKDPYDQSESQKTSYCELELMK